MGRIKYWKKVHFGLNKKLVSFVRVWRIQALHDKQFKTTSGKKKLLKIMGCITSAMGYNFRNGCMRDIDLRSDM